MNLLQTLLPDANLCSLVNLVTRVAKTSAIQALVHFQASPMLEMLWCLQQGEPLIWTLMSKLDELKSDNIFECAALEPFI